MKKFDKRVVVGTKVCINGSINTVTEVVNGGTHIKLKEFMGSFQSGHIDSFSNVKNKPSKTTLGRVWIRNI